MKKILILFTVLFTFCLSAFAEYKPIPKELSKQYKAEMEKVIKKEYPKAIKNVDKYVKKAKKLHARILKHGYYSNNQMDAINLSLLYEVCIPSSELDLYSKLIKITEEKYLHNEYEAIGTDSVNPLSDYLYPYFKDNNVDTKKLDDIALYEVQQGKIIEKLIEQVEKLRPISD